MLYLCKILQLKKWLNTTVKFIYYRYNKFNVDTNTDKVAVCLFDVSTEYKFVILGVYHREKTNSALTSYNVSS